MKIRRHLSYANVTATIALVAALATGGAYAQSRIATGDIQPRAVTGPKIAKNAIGGGVHVRRNTISGRHLREDTIDARSFSSMDSDRASICDPPDGVFIDCAEVTMELPARGRVLVIASGGAYSEGGDAASGRCEVRVDGQTPPFAQFPGEENAANTSQFATSGFSVPHLTPVLPRGSVEIALACRQSGPNDFRIQGPTIAAIALTHGRP